MTIEKIYAFRRLLIVWLIGVIVLGGLTLAQTIGGAFGRQWEHIAESWAVFFPWLIPGVIVMIGLNRVSTGEMISKFSSTFSIWASIAYIVMLLATWLGYPMSEKTHAEWLLTSYIWVLPFQIALDVIIIRMIRS